MPENATDHCPRSRVDQLDGVAVSFTGIFNTLILRHWDVPGELAHLTKELSDGGINIANMSLMRVSCQAK